MKYNKAKGATGQGKHSTVSAFEQVVSRDASTKAGLSKAEVAMEFLGFGVCIGRDRITNELKAKHSLAKPSGKEGA